MNRLTAIAAAAVLATSGLARADYPPTATAPAGYPPNVPAMQPAAEPATPPAAASPAASPAARPAPKVQVFPFEPVGDGGDVAWVGKGLQASLQSDVSRTGAVLLMAPGAPAPGFDPLAIARSNGADLVVTGTYQAQGGDVRADGHLIDVATGQQVGGFSGRAPQANVFQLEDAVGQQLQRLLPIDRPAARAAAAYQPAAGSVRPDGTSATMPQPITVVDDPTPSYTEPATTVTNNSYYTQPATAYSYPDSFYGGYGGYGYGYDGGYYGGYYPFGLGFYGGLGFYPGFYGGFYGRGYGHGYGYGYGSGRGYGGGYGGLRANPTFHGGGSGFGRGGGYVQGGGGGRSYFASRGASGFGLGGGFRAASFGSGGGFGGGGGFHGGGGHR